MRTAHWSFSTRIGCRSRAYGGGSSSSSRLTGLLVSCRLASTCTTPSSAVRSLHHRDVLGVWNRGSTSAAARPTLTQGDASASKALQFVLGGSKRAVAGSTRKPMAPNPPPVVGEESDAPSCSPNDVAWVMCERMDFLMQYVVPSSWVVREMARENHVAIQCFPPPLGDNTTQEPPAGKQSRALLHGISINAFAYHRKVADPSPDRLMDTFLKRFGPTCEGGRVEIIRRSVTAGVSEAKVGDAHVEKHWVDKISEQVGGCVCEISFEPRTASPEHIEQHPSDPPAASPPRTKARGLCRTFYSSNHRFHHVILAVVPEPEYAASELLMSHALMHFGTLKPSSVSSNF